MAQLSVGEALSKLLAESNWQARINKIRLQQEWPNIVGATIAKYTTNINLTETTLYLSTEIAALKNEILINKADIIGKINQHLQARIVTEIVVR